MSKPFKMVKGGTHTAEPGTRISRYEKHEKERDISIGFRLVFDDGQRKAQGAPWTIPEPEGLGALNRPHSSGPTVGFRLVRGEGGK